MRNLIICMTVLLSVNAFAEERIYIGKFFSREPNFFSFRKVNGNQVVVRIEARIFRAEDDDREIVRKFVPELYIKGKRQVYYKELQVGRTEKLLSRGWINNELVKFDISKEGRAYHVYMTLK